MTTTLSENMTENTINSIITVQMCDGYGGWWTACEFERTIFVSVAGLCSSQTIDRIFSLIEPKEGEKKRMELLLY